MPQQLPSRCSFLHAAFSLVPSTALTYTVMTSASHRAQHPHRIRSNDRTRIWRGDNEHDVAEASSSLALGKLVAFPTETVYGLGADARNSDAVRKVFEAKKRPADNPLIVHFWTKSTALESGLIAAPLGSIAHAITEAFWPGPLTVVLPLYPNSGLSSLVTAGLDSVAIRVPKHPVASAFLRQAGVPVAAPSANLSGRPSPTDADHVLSDLSGRIDGIVLDSSRHNLGTRNESGSKMISNYQKTYEGFDAEQNGTTVDEYWGLESTVVDLTDETQPTILRPGAITVTELERVCGRTFSIYASRVDSRVATVKSTASDSAAETQNLSCQQHPDSIRGNGSSRGNQFSDTPKAPGMKYRHYAPRAPVIICSDGNIVDTVARQRVLHPQPNLLGLLANKEICDKFAGTPGIVTVSCGMQDDTASFGRELYSSLRAFDGEGPQAVQSPGVAVIVAVGFDDSNDGLEVAVMNRLRKAAATNSVL